MAKNTRYSAKDEVDELENLSEKLTADLRKHIRSMGSFPILSDQWCEMADVLSRVAHISEMESKLPQPKKGATLWETEELALRYLLEDGKLNLCLRNLDEYKRFQRSDIKNGASGRAANLNDKCEKFEKGLGVVLRNAWQHMEALQTTDLPLLINYIGDVLESGMENNDLLEGYSRKGDLQLRQEFLVFHYLAGLMRHIDDISEDRVMPIIRDRRVFMNAVKVLCYSHNGLSSSDTLKAIDVLAMIVGTDDFHTYADEYIRGERDLNYLMDLKMSCLDNFTSDFSSRRLVRPLVDRILLTARKYGMK